MRFAASVFFLLSVLWISGDIVVNGQQPEPVDATKLAFYPERWKAEQVSFEMLAWKGERIALLTRPGDYDAEKMRAFVSILDRGWQTQARLVGRSPRPFRQIGGKATICAIPKAKLSCGYGCGYVGATGIEVSGFYNRDWPAFRKDPHAFAHYYFYEMGRNYYLFGDRHSLFTTGYAVFMRYVCMDELGCTDPDSKTRQTIERCEQVYADSEIRFFDAFTNFSAGEKGHRLSEPGGGKIVPSDQPVMYATAMLKLRRDHGEAWTGKFLHALGECQPYKATDEASAVPQCLNWLVCASVAAGEDLSPIFADRWRMPLTPEQRQLMKRTRWGASEIDVAELVRQLLAER